MRLSALLAEIERADGPITGIELADRLGVATSRVAAGLVALRASGRLAPEVRSEPAPDNCSSAGTCSMSCPGPDKCSMVIDLNITGLEIRRLR
jgi:hypothetical protein